VEHLDEISVEELQDALDNVEKTRPTQRLLVASACKNGITQTELAKGYDVQRRTIYSWLKRFVGVESLEQAVTDALDPALAFVTFPSYSPKLNPVEECWRRLQSALNNRFSTH
jgi:transposase